MQISYLNTEHAPIESYKCSILKYTERYNETSVLNCDTGETKRHNYWFSKNVLAAFC